MPFPIAECFCAPQGEGVHQGRLMIFLRFAGCTVGKPFDPVYRAQHNASVAGLQDLVLQPFQTECSVVGDRKMACDTDYRNNLGQMDERQIIDLLHATHPTCQTVCLTGGEPLMHWQNKPDEWHSLMNSLRLSGFRLHIETSGTVPIPNIVSDDPLKKIKHIAVSPKSGWRHQYGTLAHEIKFLIDDTFELSKLPDDLQHFFRISNDFVQVFLQPVNNEHTVDRGNLNLCLQWQLQYPHLLLSTQAHKLWKTR